MLGTSIWRLWRSQRVVAGEFGIDKNGNKGDGYEPEIELYGKYVLLAEGARGSLTKELIARFLDEVSSLKNLGWV